MFALIEATKEVQESLHTEVNGAELKE